MASRVPTFKKFWQAYPIHRDRLRAEKAWYRMTADDKAAAIAALPAYVRDCRQLGMPYQYAQGWLNGRRWEDEKELPQERQVSGSKFQVSSVKFQDSGFRFQGSGNSDTKRELSRKASGEQTGLLSRAERQSGAVQHSAESEPETCNLKPETADSALADMETW